MTLLPLAWVSHWPHLFTPINPSPSSSSILLIPSLLLFFFFPSNQSEKKKKEKRSQLFSLDFLPISLDSQPFKAHPELANSNPPPPTQTHRPQSEILEENQPQPQPEPEGEPYKWAVLSLYEALNNRDVDRVTQLLAPDLEWWFHGPPSHQHMMRLLTGQTSSNQQHNESSSSSSSSSSTNNFQFKPRYIEVFGSTVLVEGCDRTASVFWVHAWTVGPDGIITKVREYFNTSVTVTRFGKRSAPNCLPVWQSRLPDRAGKSLPGLVLAI